MMAQDIRTRLILDNSQFQRGMEQSQRQTKGFGQSMMGLVRTVKIATAAVAALSAGITAMARRTADSAAQIRDLSRSIGVSTGAIQRFRFAAQQSSVDISSADRALEQFTRRIGEAARGTGEARSALAEMGISLRDNNGRLRSTEDLLGDVANAFQRTGNATLNADRANRLFGRSGIELVAVLQQGSTGLTRFAREAQRLGAVIDDRDVKTLGDLSDSYTSLGAAIRGVVTQFVLGLAPSLKTTNEELTKMLANNQELARTMGEGVGEALRRIADVAVLVANSIDLIRNAIIAYLGVKLLRNLQSMAALFSRNTTNAGGLSGVVSGMTKAIREFVGVMNPKLALLIRVTGATAVLTGVLALFRNRTIQINNTTTTFGEILSAVTWKMGQFARAVASTIPSFSQVMDDIAEGFLLSGRIVRQWINFVINSFNILPEVALIAFRQLESIIKGEGLPALDEYREAIDRVFAQDHVGAMARRLSGPLQFLLSPLGRLVEEYRKTTKQIQKISDDAGPLIIDIKDGEEILGFWRRLFARIKTILINFYASLPEGVHEFVEGFKQAFVEFNNSIKTNTQLGAAVFKRFLDGMTDALTRFFTTGKLSFRNFLADIATMIIRSNVQRALVSLFGGFDFFGGALKAAAAATTAPAAPAGPGIFGLGGMIPAGKVGLVGDRGPEFIRGPAQITPIRQGDMAPQTTQVNYYIEAIDTQSFEERLARNPEFLFAVTQRGARGFAS